jgi:hypothetical protein
MTLSVTIFPDHADGFRWRLQAEPASILREFVNRNRTLLRSNDGIDERKQFALQRAMVAPGALLQKFDLLGRHVPDREIDTHGWLHFATILEQK